MTCHILKASNLANTNRDKNTEASSLEHDTTCVAVTFSGAQTCLVRQYDFCPNSNNLYELNSDLLCLVSL